MSNRRAYYYPVPLYLLMLLMVWVGAFFADVVLLLLGGMLPASSLMSPEGVRWALRSALPSISALPWGAIMMLIATYGLLRGSGLAKVLCRLLCFRRLTLSQWRALLFSLLAAVCYIALLYMFTVAPWSLLSGVTHEASLSPLVQGWALLLFAGSLLVSLIYGFINGNYRSMMDVIVSTANTFNLFVPAIMALIPASGIVPCMRHAGVDAVCGISMDSIAVVLYLLPFLYIVILEMKKK